MTELDRPEGQAESAPFRFHGEGGEFFRIWLVNLALTLVTLGFYSPWAKVRNRQYLYGHTELAGHRFAYTADPVKILYGRLIALTIFGLYLFAGLNPVLGAIMALVMLFFWPWAMTRGMMFNARYSEYRGIHFSFSGSALEVFFLFFLLPPLTVLTLGLVLPYLLGKQKEYVVGHHWYGRQQFEVTMPVGKVYAFCLGFGLVGLGVFLGALLLTGLIGTLGDIEQNPFLLMAAMVPLYLAAILVFPLFKVVLMELALRHSKLEGLSFQSSLKWGRAIWILLTNQLGIIATLGLFIPFAKVRWAHYRAETLMMTPAEGLDNLVALQEEELAALGAESSEIFDVDLALGL
ncbi:YjgN family protein [Ferrimonas balearica]|uniref:YjgN family protein n=1 Tax=Ferrimonas balearica TaxID=44012 RepID=UPI001C99F3FB|nr:YjgN family protein [Ferrimonas balearica]MBY5994048.1 DUF898 domain-containing protein [Ferrimonas balearica]